MFGPGGISIPQLLILLVIVLAIFGTKKLRNMGGDVGTAVKGFKNAVKEGGEEAGDKIEDKTADAAESVAKKTEDKV